MSGASSIINLNNYTNNGVFRIIKISAAGYCRSDGIMSHLHKSFDFPLAGIATHQQVITLNSPPTLPLSLE